VFLSAEACRKRKHGTGDQGGSSLADDLHTRWIPFDSSVIVDSDYLKLWRALV
jgi:hypothetical protein